MFYVKETIGDTTEINIEINDENVFCRCPVCGREVLVDLEEVLGVSNRILVMAAGRQAGILDHADANDVSVMELATA